MHTVELQFKITGNGSDDDRDSALGCLMNALRMNGQILGSDFPMANLRNGFKLFTSIPEKSSLSPRHANGYVKSAVRDMSKAGLKLSVVRHGPDPESAIVCRCKSRIWMILFTTYLSAEPPVRCGSCFGVIPLYRLPKTYDDSYYDIICWHGDYRACDRLQMGCATGERFGTAEISRLDSSLSQRGRAICDALTTSTKIPTYYYLYRYPGRSLSSERARRCPSCGGKWLADASIHGKFDMKCDKCRLLSNIAWNVR